MPSTFRRLAALASCAVVVGATPPPDHPADWDPAQYDGGTFTGDSKPDHLAVPTVHAIYLYPSEATSRFARFAAMFQADAAQASDLVKALYGTGVRFDMRKGSATAKKPRRGLPRHHRGEDPVQRQAAGRRSPVHSGALRADRQGLQRPDKKYVVWLDAASLYCGQGELYQDPNRDPAANANQKRTTAIVYRPYSTTNADGGFCRSRTVLHEVGHNLGALQSVAENASDGAHCDDDNNDVMCYTASDQFDSGSSKFDYNNNDYWDPPGGVPLPHWTVNLSRFVCTSINCSGFDLTFPPT